MAELPERIDRIVLIGLMGAGKSTVGARLAHRLNWKFADLDLHIEQYAGKSVADIFEAEGEATFRRLERQLTSELLSLRHLVLAPGGGWAVQLDPTVLPDHTAIFWLQVSPEELITRLAHGPPRPLLAGDPLDRARQLAEGRNSIYAKLGVPLDTMGRDPDEIVNDILNMAGLRIRESESSTSLEHG